MIWPIVPGRKRESGGAFNRRQRQNAARVVALQRQELGSMFVKKEQWTEEEVLALPAGEHDYFERKSGLLFDDPAGRNKLYDALAKAASAFANSGGVLSVPAGATTKLLVLNAPLFVAKAVQEFIGALAVGDCKRT